jgi:hypothetical protein
MIISHMLKMSVKLWDNRDRVNHIQNHLVFYL